MPTEDGAQSPAGVRILYAIEGTTLFGVNKTSGQVRVAQLIDREQTSDSVRFQVIATPYYGPNRIGQAAQLTITVFILDENDNPPRIERIRVGGREYDAQTLARQFNVGAFLATSSVTVGPQLRTGPTVRLNVSENTPIETTVVDLIEAVDVDKASTNPLSAVCLDCEPEFELRPSSADSTLNDRLERSVVLIRPLVHVPRNNVRQLHVNVNDGKFNTSILFEITIDDVQNRPPQFMGSTTCIVKENIAIDRVIMTVQAVDGDALALDDMIMPPKGKTSTGRQIIYDFVGPNGQSASQQEDFKLHPLTGQLQVANRLDREAYLQSNGVLLLRVRARELTVDPDTVVERDDLFDSILNKLMPFVDPSADASNEVEITVILVDVNDNEPHWLNSSEVNNLNLNQSPSQWHQSLPNDRDTGRNYQIRVAENTLPGSPITSKSDLFVYDLDNGDNAHFNISLVDPFNLFDVEPKQANGFAHVTLKLTNQVPKKAARQLLDYENINERSYIIELHATETRTSERSSSKAQVQVFVVDVNDNAPEFNETAYVANIREDAQPGRTVKLIQATDRDEISRRITYSLHGKSSYLFDIHPTTGLVTVARCDAKQQQQQHQQAPRSRQTSVSPSRPCIDYETQRSHHLMVQASDGELSSKVPLTVFIDDASDNAPVFRLPIVDVVIEEGSERLDPPIKIEASDVDQTSVITYSIVEGNFEGLFGINNVTGELQLTRPIRIAHDDDPSSQPADYNKSQHQKWNKMDLIVQASDGVHTSNGTIRIDVLDANDNAPQFVKSHYEKEINESFGPNQHVVTVKAFDLDRGNNARVSYRLERGSHGQFTINESSGEISVAPDARLPFDATKRDNYTLEVVAHDHGLISKSSSVLVSVRVLDSSRRAPQFVPQIQRATVHEGTLNNTIIHRMVVADDDHEQNSPTTSMLVFEPGPIEALDKFGLQVTDTERLESMFSVSTETGDVVVRTGLDHQFAAHVNLTVYVTSRSLPGSFTGQLNASNKGEPLGPAEEFAPRSTGYLIINVLDDNTNAPFFAPPWTPGQPELSFSIAEELPVGSVLTQLVANDLDSKISHFKIEPANEYFELSSAQSGVIVTKKVIDYDALMRQTFLTPGSHHRPGSMQQQAAQTMQAGQPNNVIQFNVFAYDSGEPQLSAKAIVSVEILPINDWDCKFEQANYEAHVRENSQVDTVVVQVRANDLDYGEQHNQVSYSLLGDQRDLFNIDQRTGVVTVSNRGSINLDREKLSKSSITLTVIGRDEQSSESARFKSPQQVGRTCSASLRVHVDDVNDNPPLFSQKLYEVTAYDTDTIDVPLIRLITRDEDSMANLPGRQQQTGANTFRIVAGNINDSFNITSNGVIYATKALNESLASLQAGQPIQLRVQVKQQTSTGGLVMAPALPTIFTDECLVKINLLKINRFAPEWRQESLKAAVEENQRPGTLVSQLRCSDRDYSARRGLESLEQQEVDTRKKPASQARQQDSIRYWIKENGQNVLETREFRLDPVSGNLTTRVALDRETQEFYELIVSCEDNGKPQSLESIAPMYIPVLDVDDNKPEFVVQREVRKTPDRLPLERATKPREPSVSFSVEEQQGKGLPVGELKAFDRDLRSKFPIIYCLIEGNEFQEFSLDSVTGILYTNHTLDREKQSTYDLLVKAVNDGTSCEDHLISSESGNATATKSSNGNQQDSVILVRVQVLDMNDNSPVFRRQIHRAGVHHRSLMNTLVTQVAAYDPDSGLNGTLNYKISEILMYKTSQGQQNGGASSSSSRRNELNDNHGQQLASLSKPIKLIQSPFKIDQQGNLYTQQLLTQYPLMCMFVLQIEASEQAEPWRTATTKLEVHIYETNNQLKMKINLHPKLIEVYRFEIESLLSNATKYTAIINRARSYTGNVDANTPTSKTSNLNKATSKATSVQTPTTTMTSSEEQPNFSYIHLIFVDNYRIVNPNLVMEKFDLTSAQLFTPQLLTTPTMATSNNGQTIKAANELGLSSSDLQLIHDQDVSSLIDKIALASVQSAEYHSHPSGLAGIDWLESPSIIYVTLTALLTLMGLLMCLIGCCCTSRIKDHIIKVAMDKMVRQQALQAKINERVLAATNQAYAQSHPNGGHPDYMIQAGGLMSSFDATKSCINNNYENMSMLQRAMEAGEFIDPNYTTLNNGHLNMGAHYYDATELEEQQQHQIDIGADNDHHEPMLANGAKQINGSTVSLSLVDDMDEVNNDNHHHHHQISTHSNNLDNHNDSYPVGDLNNHLVKNKSKLFTNGTNGVVSSNSRLRQQIPTNNLQHEL